MVWEEFICDSRYASVSISSFDRGIVELESKRHKNGMREREKKEREKRVKKGWENKENFILEIILSPTGN